MRRQRGLVGLMGLAALVGLGAIAKPAAAAITTEQSASILVFPKVIANGTRDTIIQITNTSNNMRHAHCFYVNAAPTIPELPPGPSNPPLWTEIDFDIWLTKQQPTHWVVSAGRLDDPDDRPCRGATSRTPAVVCDPATSGTENADCCDAGFDPGRVPPVAPDFTGELKCIEVDAGGFPVPGNALKGEATLVDLATGDVSKYNAIGLKGFDTNNMDGVLCLGGAGSELCPNGAEYEACPSTWLLDHAAENAPDRVVEQEICDEQGITECSSSITTNLTVVPCTENFETQEPITAKLQFLVTNEFEQTFSASTSVTCWASLDLSEINSIFDTNSLGGAVAQTRMRLGAASPSGVLAVLEETHTATFTATGAPSVTLTARAAQNGHTTFVDRTAQDIITIPADQIQQVP